MRRSPESFSPTANSLRTYRHHSNRPRSNARHRGGRNHTDPGREAVYGQRVAAHGVLGSLSVPLPFQGATNGALNTYANRPQAFGEHDLVLAEKVAAWVAIAVAMQKQQPGPATISTC
jgi:GAF domain-containing protein